MAAGRAFSRRYSVPFRDVSESHRDYPGIAKDLQLGYGGPRITASVDYNRKRRYLLIFDLCCRAVKAVLFPLWRTKFIQGEVDSDSST